MTEETSPSIHTVCRTCLSNLQHNEAFDLFVVPGLAKKLCVCTSLSVEHLDGFPRNLCTTCHSRLNDLHDFQKQCVDSVQKFKELISSTCIVITTIPEDDPGVVDAAVQDVVHDEEHINFDPLLDTKMEVDNEADVFKMIEDVDKESEEVDNQEDAFNDSGSDYNNEDADFQVDSSDSDDEMPLSRLRSTSRATKSKTKQDDKDKSKEKPKRKRIPAAERELHRLIECHICRQKFKKAVCYEEHMKRHNDLLPFQCTVKKCQRGFTTSTGLKHHMEHAHTELCDLHPCTVEGCNEAFAQTRMLTQHLRKVHNIAKPEIHPCSECEKVFRCPMALKKHMYKHTGEELPFGCNICQKRFRVNTELRDHLLRHAGIRNFVCPYCGVGRTTKQELDKHILTHTKEKKFKCDQCDHTSHNKQCMTKHIKVVHMKIRNYLCQYCQKSFASAYHCKNHEKLHTRNDCFECKICGRKFLFESRLTKHLRTHAKKGSKTTASSTKTETDVETAQTESTEVMKVPEIPVKPRDPRRIEIVDISQLAGTIVNPIPSVSVSSWSPQENFTKNEGQIVCPDCGRGFNHLSNMKLHYKVVHEKIKDYACRFCPKRFSRSQYLRHHEYTHTGEKPYECKVCNQRFRHDATLGRHMQSHNRPPKDPKNPKRQRKDPQEPRLTLNTEPIMNYEQYQDPDAEREAATAELVAQQLNREEGDAKPKWGLAKGGEVQEAACEQLQKLRQKQLEKVSYDSFADQVPESGIRKDIAKNHV
ncbi:zinc finger protein 708-like [Drosophila innubila]|uniref:zinc finger protein 708-like n=1 Tax=Drosophila innubila TaxID=198719 RepID=UPI00148E3B5E|nr:zinc finger protein 708-like [Drosophila innubila]